MKKFKLKLNFKTISLAAIATYIVYSYLNPIREGLNTAQQIALGQSANNLIKATEVPKSESKEPKKSEPMGAGAIAGIVIGAILLMGLLFMFMFIAGAATS